MEDKDLTKARSPESDFAHEAEQESSGLVSEFWYFLTHNKKWWLTPIILALLAVGVIIALGSTAAAPFIYTLF